MPPLTTILLQFITKAGWPLGYPVLQARNSGNLNKNIQIIVMETEIIKYTFFIDIEIHYVVIFNYNIIFLF